MRWSSPARLVFLLPAVAWVLAFTVFPLGYSLYLAFFKIESKVEVTREKVPVLDEQGEPVLTSSGQPRTRNVVHKNQVTTSEFVGSFNFERLLDDPQVATAIRVTAVFVLIAVPAELSVAGFDDAPLAQLVWPPLTTIHQPVRQLAVEATDLLFGEAGSVRCLTHALVVRESTSPPSGLTDSTAT